MNHETQDLDLSPVSSVSDVGAQVPLIDAADLKTKLYSSSVSSLISNASEEWGFFQLINHGICDSLIAEVWKCSKWFFAQDRAEKETLLRTLENPWGYYNNELTKNQRDKKEVFDFTRAGTDPIYNAENRWPLAHKYFQTTLLQYFEACSNLSFTLMNLLWKGMEVPTDFMKEDLSNHHTSFVRLNYYPVADPMENSDQDYQKVADMGVHHHTDAGILTILAQDSVGGLQVYKDGYWHNVPSTEGALVINTGDMAKVISNGRYQAAMHRVIAMKKKDRYSIPFFFNPSQESVISPFSTEGDSTFSPRYRPISWKEFRGKRTEGDYADYGKEVQIEDYLYPAI
jgi:isopenicillin N synthase-like dioxygenase